MLLKENISIERYNAEKALEYETTITRLNIPPEFFILKNLKFKHEKNVFLLINKCNRKFLWFKTTQIQILGYCIIENAKRLPYDLQTCLEGIYSIPLCILETHFIVISDFMISQRKRKNGYGKFLADHILSIFYSDCNISLHAVDDGLWFWKNFGFEVALCGQDVMILTNRVKH